MTEQNQDPGITADDTQGHVHYRMSEVDDATGHVLRRDEDDTQDRPVHRHDDDVQGHLRREAEDDEDDTEGRARRVSPPAHTFENNPRREGAVFPPGRQAGRKRR